MRLVRKIKKNIVKIKFNQKKINKTARFSTENVKKSVSDFSGNAFTVVFLCLLILKIIGNC